MRRALWIAVTFSLCASVPASVTAQMDSCATCHAALPDRLGVSAEAVQQGVHGKHGISCADCHGGDPSILDLSSMAPEKGFRGKITRQDVPTLCAQCHSDPAYMRRFNPSLPTDQLERYRTSVHGQKLIAGDRKVATCTSCHGVHGILAADLADSPVYPANIPATCGGCHSDTEHMAGYGIPTTQEKDYRDSVHGQLLLQKRDLGAPNCATCHGNHGAYPPGVTSIAEVCGQCHVNNTKLFVQSRHKVVFDQLGLPECVTCHGNHAVQHTSDEMLGVGENALCIRCHTEATAGYAEAKRMREMIESLKSAIANAGEALQRAEELGMEVSTARYDFHEADAILIKARTEIHRFSAPYVGEVVAPGMALSTRIGRVADDAIAEGYARRWHLLFPLALILLLIYLLVLKLRQLEKR